MGKAKERIQKPKFKKFKAKRNFQSSKIPKTCGQQELCIFFSRSGDALCNLWPSGDAGRIPHCNKWQSTVRRGDALCNLWPAVMPAESPIAIKSEACNNKVFQLKADSMKPKGPKARCELTSCTTHRCINCNARPWLTTRTLGGKAATPSTTGKNVCSEVIVFIAIIFGIMLFEKVTV